MSPDRVIARAIASAAAGLNGFGFLRCSTLDFIDVYLRDVEAEPEGREVGMLAAIAKKSAASNVVRSTAILRVGTHQCYANLESIS
jgi:hypothetical protein